MNYSGDIELIADTLLIQKMVTIEYGIQKSAGIADTLKGMLGDGLSTISGAVKNSLSGLVDTTDGKSVAESVGNIIATGGLFKLWAPLGLLNVAASSIFGINVITIAEQIWDYLKDKIFNGEQVTSGDVSEATKSVIGEIIASGAYYGDPFVIIRLAEQQGKLFRLLKSGGNAGMFSSLFSSLNPTQSKSIIGGFVGWAIKAALLGAGLLAAGGFVTNLLGINKKTNEEKLHPSSTVPAGGAYEDKPSISTGLEETGSGQNQHNQSGSKWIVPIPNGSIHDMLLQWAAYVYRDFQNKDEWPIIASTQSFNKIVNELEQSQESNSDQLTVPPQYHSIKQVVDLFASEAVTKIKGQNG